MSSQRKAPPGEGSERPARPFGARSVMASLLLGMHPPRLRGALLVRWCGLFGIAEGTARVALSRMAARGELLADDGTYTLAGPLAGRQAHQDWALAPRLRAWQGAWRIEVVAGVKRAADERAELRVAMRRLRLAEWREGVWLRPDNLPGAAAPDGTEAVVRAQCTRIDGVPDADPVALVDELFEPARWAQRAGGLTRTLSSTTARLVAGDIARLDDGFAAGAAALAHIRDDPLVPSSLLSNSWPGDALRDAYHRYQAAFAEATRQWFRTQRTLSSLLPGD